MSEPDSKCAKTESAQAEEEVENLKDELGRALQERTVLYTLLKDTFIDQGSADVETFLANARLQKKHKDRLFTLNNRIEAITRILVP
jgi:hypothetical protein